MKRLFRYPFDGLSFSCFGRALSKEGRAVTDQTELHSMLRKGIDEFLRGKWGYIQVMGG